jgi:uncharacterized protein YlxW (UPF0749 family)
MTARPAQLILGAACFVFGLLLMVQFRTQGTIAKMMAQSESASDQTQIISNLYDANVTLRKEVDTLQRQQQDQESGRATARLAQMLTDLEKLRVVNGVEPAVGPGVELTVAADIRAEDVQDLMNELRNAGAEAVALSGMRITARSAITEQRGAVILDGRQLTAPFVFDAVGAPDVLERALSRKGGLVSYLQTTYPEGKIDVAKRDKLALPASTAGLAFSYAESDKRTGT